MDSRNANRYPGGPLFNPLGLAKTAKDAEEWKLKEIKNGKLFNYPQLFLIFATVMAIYLISFA